MWIIIATADNDQVFHTAGDEQLAILHKPNIARTQKRPFTGPGQVGLKRVRRFLWTVPVTHAHTRSGYPDFADVAVLASGVGIGIYNRNLLARDVTAASHQCSRCL